MPQIPDGPLIVGVADSAIALGACAALPLPERPFDLVEARVDLFLSEGQRLTAEAAATCARLEASGTPVMITIRSATQGGRFTGPEPERLARFQAAVAVASWADVEDDAPIAGDVSALFAARPGGQLVVSHHDFGGTPPLRDVLAVIDRCHAIGRNAIAKVATAVRSDADRAVLRDLLAQRPMRTAVIGMGDDAFRIELAAAGSRLAYGFVGAPTAPGQTSAESLHDRLTAAVPAYAARRPRTRAT